MRSLFSLARSREAVAQSIADEGGHEPRAARHRRTRLFAWTLMLAGTICMLAVAAASAASPRVTDVYARGVSGSAATVLAKIDPMGLATVYHVEYGLDSTYGTSVPATGASAGSGSEDVVVSQILAGLTPGAVYHYRFVAANQEGVTGGPDMVFKTYPTPAAAADTCPNAEVRGEQFSSYLPDCRAYEMVSSPEKNGVNVGAESMKTQSSVDGDAVKYVSDITPYGDAQGSQPIGSEYVSHRSSDGSGWIEHGINPQQDSKDIQVFKGPHYVAFSEDLSKGIYYGESPLLAGHPNVERNDNIYLRTDVLGSPPGSYELLSDSFQPLPPRQEGGQEESQFAAASADWSHILFESFHDLTPEAQGLGESTQKAYEWHNGVSHLIGILPNGTPAPTSAAGAGVGTSNVPGFRFPECPGAWATNAISADGSRVIFTVPQGKKSDCRVQGALYMRTNESSTVQLNVSERSQPDPNGEQPAIYVAAASDDSKILFLSAQALTDDAIVNATSKKLYMYDVNSPEGRHLTLISVDAEPADNRGQKDFATGVAALTADARFIYFTGNNRLLPGQAEGDHSGFLYVWHDGTIRLIAQEYSEGPNGGTEHFRAWGQYGVGDGNTVRISDDGKTAMFLSANFETAQQFGYDNRQEECGVACGIGDGRSGFAECRQKQFFVTEGRYEYPRVCDEMYVYDYDSRQLRCVSCGTVGERPLSDVRDNATATESTEWSIISKSITQYLNRPLTNDGRYVFFDTFSPLVEQDTNGLSDVYEYDLSTDELHLISSGICSCDARFLDASADGGNVFFTTGQPLVRTDVDGDVDLYDARIDGGIAAQNVVPPLACIGEECQGPSPAAPVFSLPASSTFAGLGNASATQAARVVRRVKPAKKHRKRHRRRLRVRSHKATPRKVSNGKGR